MNLLYKPDKFLRPLLLLESDDELVEAVAAVAVAAPPAPAMAPRETGVHEVGEPGSPELDGPSPERNLKSLAQCELIM